MRRRRPEPASRLLGGAAAHQYPAGLLTSCGMADDAEVYTDFFRGDSDATARPSASSALTRGQEHPWITGPLARAADLSDDRAGCYMTLGATGKWSR